MEPSRAEELAQDLYNGYKPRRFGGETEGRQHFRALEVFLTLLPEPECHLISGWEPNGNPTAYALAGDVLFSVEIDLTGPSSADPTILVSSRSISGSEATVTLTGAGKHEPREWSFDLGDGGPAVTFSGLLKVDPTGAGSPDETDVFAQALAKKLGW